MTKEYSNVGSLICDYEPWCRCLKCDPTSAPRYCHGCGGEEYEDYNGCTCEPEYEEDLYEEHDCGEDTCVCLEPRS